MPIQPRGDRGGFQVVIRWKGKRLRRSSSTWTRAEAKRVEREWLNELERQEENKDRPTLAAVLERYAADHLSEQKGADKSIAHLKHLLPFMEGRYVDEAPDIANEYRAANAHLAPATVSRRLAILKRLASLAFRWRWVDVPYHQQIDMPSVGKKNQRHVYLTIEQVEELASRMPRAGGYCLLAAYTGIRKGQLLNLHSKQVIDGMIHLGTDGKTGLPQVVPVHPRIDYLVGSLPLPGVTDQIRRDEWEKARKECGLEHVRWHDLRHTIASWLIQNGASLAHVRDLLGHADTRTTERYAHLDAQHHLKATVLAIGEKRPPERPPKKKANPSGLT